MIFGKYVRPMQWLEREARGPRFDQYSVYFLYIGIPNNSLKVYFCSINIWIKSLGLWKLAALFLITWATSQKYSPDLSLSQTASLNFWIEPFFQSFEEKMICQIFRPGKYCQNKGKFRQEMLRLKISPKNAAETPGFLGYRYRHS